MRQAASWKSEVVEEIKKDLKSNPVAAIVSIKGIRNAQLQKIRNDLRGKLKLRVVRRRLLLRALDDSKLDILGAFKEFVEGQIGLVTTSAEPTSLYRMLEETKQKAPARGGETAEGDIIIEPMETSFPPGPMISEFQKVGLTTAIEKGKIVIKKENVFVKEGEVIPRDKAKILEKLEIHPITVGLDIMGAYSDGLIYSRDVLSVSIEQILTSIVNAFSGAKQLAVDIMFLVPEIVPEMLVKAKINAEYLALESKFIDEGSIQLFILKALREAQALSGSLSGEEPEEKEPEPEKKAEEKAKDSEESISEGLDSLFG